MDRVEAAAQIEQEFDLLPVRLVFDIEDLRVTFSLGFNSQREQALV